MKSLQLQLRLICCLTATISATILASLIDFPASQAQALLPQALPQVENEDWPWWRGGERNGHAPAGAYPTHFSLTENVIWKSPIPGRGHSSPIVVGNSIFLTTAEANSQTQSVLAFDKTLGSLLWRRDVNRGGFPDNNHRKNTEATSTLASDGERLFATFFHHQQIHLLVLGFDGQIVEDLIVGPFDPKKFEYGYAPSPLIYRDMVIVAAEHDGESYIAAYSRQDLSTRWRIIRPSNISFSTPVVAHVAGRDQLLISGSEQVMSYDPTTGKLIWQVSGTTAATCGTMVWSDELVFASGGYPKAETLAVRADGSGQVVWSNEQKCYEQSMILVDQYLYALTDKGVMYCWRADDGREMWRERLEGPVSASGIYAGGNIYWANEQGALYVFKPSPERFQLIAENRLGSEAFASPAATAGRLIFRIAETLDGTRQEYLVCIGSM
jgi:outer membrane protein assembly factor BamB